MFEIAVNGEKYKVSWRHNRTDGHEHTICFFVGNRTTINGVAKCHIKDNYCKNTGRKLSLARAIKNFDKEERRLVWQAYFHMRRSRGCQ